VVAAIEADIAIGAFLRSTLPPSLAPLPLEAGMPPLPMFNVNLYVREGSASPVVEELALHIRRRLAKPAMALAA
jgi:hypothetical protein